MHVGFVVTHGPPAEEFARFEEAVRKEMAAGHRVEVFADVDAVLAGLETRGEAPVVESLLAALARDGARVTVCRVCARNRGLHRGKVLAGGVSSGDLGELSRLVANADRMVCL